MAEKPNDMLTPPPGAVPLDPPPGAVPLGPPEGASPLEEEPGMGDKIVSRFLGTDIEEDPLMWTRLGTTITGGVVGGLVGSKAGATLGSFTGPLAPYAVPAFATVGGITVGGAGAFVGAIAPESFIEAAEEFGLVGEGTRERIGLSPEELRTIAEGEALLDMATGGGITILRGTGRGASALFTGARKNLAEKAAASGIDLIPVQVGNRIVGRGFVSVFGRFPLLGGGKVRRGAAAAEDQMRNVMTGLAERTGPVTSGSELGTTIFKDATKLVKEINESFGRKYNAVFAQAEEYGVYVVPKNTLGKADEILAKIRKETPAQMTGEPKPAKVLQGVVEFIEEEVAPLRAASEVTPTGIGAAYANQSLRQMDGLIAKVDQYIATLEPGQKKFARSLLMQLRQAAQADAIQNVRGVNSSEVARSLKALDAEFSHTMDQLFDTATAKRFGSVRKRGLRASEFDETTRTPVDKISKIVVDLDSPQAIEELSRLVHLDTMAKVASHTIDNAFQLSMKTDGFVGQLDIEVFARRLGLDGTNKAKRETIQKMLEKSGSDLTINDLDTLVEVGRALSSFDIPNVSSFIARRGAIGGIQGIINGVVPGLALMGGSAGAAAYSGSTVVGSIMFIGGSHLFSAVVSNPLNARALHQVFQKETTKALRRKAMVQVLRGGVTEMFDTGDITDEKYNQLLDTIDKTMDAFDRHYESMESE